MSLLPVQLRAEYAVDPLGIDVPQPRMTWRYDGDLTDETVLEAQVEVLTRSDDGDERTWLSGWDSVPLPLLEYNGPTLRSRDRIEWRVRIRSAAGEGPWSSQASWEMGLLEPSDWSAQWVEPEQEPVRPEPKPFAGEIDFDNMIQRPQSRNDALHSPQHLRREFHLDGPVDRARLYVTARGVYALEVNGQRLNPAGLSPDWTPYDRITMVQAYDVTDTLSTGRNAIGVILADGWFAGRVGMFGESVNYGDRLALLLQLEVVRQDGGRLVITSDGDFTSGRGVIDYADAQVGERHDLRRDTAGWSEPGFDETGWHRVRPVGRDGIERLGAQRGPAPQIVVEVPAVDVARTAAGTHLVDLGQVIAGRARLQFDAPEGAEVRLRHFSVLDESGEPFKNVMGVNNILEDVVVAAGGPAVFEPRFTFHDFRWIEIVGLDDVKAEDVTGVVLSSLAESNAVFSSTSAALTQLWSNIVWTTRSNQLSVPTDNPDRERAGFTGDAGVTVATTLTAFDAVGFFERWLRDLRLEQLPNGEVPVVVPYFASYQRFWQVIGGGGAAAAWGDAIIEVPWALYRRTGDIRILRDNFGAMSRWVDAEVRAARDSTPPEGREDNALIWWPSSFQFGDWLTPSRTTLNSDLTYDAMNSAETRLVVPTMYLARSAAVLAAVAGRLGETEAAKRLDQLAADVRNAFVRTFVTTPGRLEVDLPGMYVLALQFGLVDSGDRPAFAARLAELIREGGHRADTGFLSTQFLLPVLAEHGYVDDAWQVLLQTAAPSWLAQVHRGATTVWEMWESVDAAGRPTRTSVNQGGLGSVGQWLVGGALGISTDMSGERDIRIAPALTDRIEGCSGSVDTPRGRVAVDWKSVEDGWVVEVQVPDAATAEVALPGRTEVVTAGTSTFHVPQH